MNLMIQSDCNILTHHCLSFKFFYFYLRRDHQKNFYVRRDYKSVDEKSYFRLCPEKIMKERIQAVKG